jgi:methionine-rich copper-binding protein CopC
MRRLIVPALAAALIAAPALAHPKVVSSTPAAEATVAPISRVEVKFSEKLVAQFAGASLDMTDMPGMKMNAPMKMKVATSVSPDGMTLIATTPKPLPKGTYKLNYHVVSSDTHRVEGDLGFKVQ